MTSRLGPALLAFSLLSGATPSAGGTPAGDDTGSAARLGDKSVYVFHASLNDVSPDERARRATTALQAVLDAPAQPLRIERADALLVVLGGGTPLLQLGPDDAAAVGDASLELHAEAVRAALDATLASERTRRSVANVVFSVSLVVFAALVLLLLARRLSELAKRALAWLERHPEKLTPLSFGGFEVLGGATLRALATSAATLGFPLATGLLGVAWLLFSFSLFEATRPLGERLSGAIFGPLADAFTRLGAGFPIAVLVVSFGFVVAVLLRFVGLYFSGVERGELELPGVEPARAPAISFVVRLGLLVLGFAVAGPLVSGEDAWLLRWAGAALVCGVALSTVPVLANVVAGLPVLFGRQHSPGDRLVLGPSPQDVGVVLAVDLTGTRVRLRNGALRHVPHLHTLLHGTSRWPGGEPATFELLLDAKVPASRVLKLLEATVKAAGCEGSGTLVELDAEAARYLLFAVLAPGHEDLLGALTDALVREGLAFRRLRRVGA